MQHFPEILMFHYVILYTDFVKIIMILLLDCQYYTNFFRIPLQYEYLFWLIGYL
jgi:hypothetical protein